ncbi:hypothetical protein B0T25DRAFT_362849 [Lasiosphaeria hispida]|uniref:Uncharacterized protein n=1 Tax=Lasiosphaeria hispida TaxID=260671 RepID=A0AAJ0H510_9PEZI|nr:hypothetical protein B0T25DRAFT_362849 [Lasiosphaeria hispida]
MSCLTSRHAGARRTRVNWGESLTLRASPLLVGRCQVSRRPIVALAVCQACQIFRSFVYLRCGLRSLPIRKKTQHGKDWTAPRGCYTRATTAITDPGGEVLAGVGGSCVQKLWKASSELTDCSTAGACDGARLFARRRRTCILVQGSRVRVRWMQDTLGTRWRIDPRSSNGKQRLGKWAGALDLYF